MQKYTEIIKSNPAFKIPCADAQSYLFCGADPLGLLLFARLFIEKQCGKQSSADIIELPAGDKILVGDIDFLTKTAALTPVELAEKYYILKAAETMNDSAANKLLKTLEEPPAKTKIIILSNDERAVLPTIRSRCTIISVPPFDEKGLGAIVDKYYQDSPNAYIAKEIALGSITRLESAINGEFTSIIQAVFDTLLFMKTSAQILQFSQQIISFKDRINDIIDLTELVLSDCIRCRHGAEITLKHRRPDILRIADFYNDDTIIRLKDIFTRARRRLELSGNPNSVVDEFLFSILETRKKFTI